MSKRKPNGKMLSLRSFKLSFGPPCRPQQSVLPQPSIASRKKKKKKKKIKSNLIHVSSYLVTPPCKPLIASRKKKKKEKKSDLILDSSSPVTPPLTPVVNFQQELKFRITYHAQERMVLRSVSVQTIRSVLAQGTKPVHSHGVIKHQVGDVTVVTTVDKSEVITVYRKITGTAVGSSSSLSRERYGLLSPVIRQVADN